MYPPMIRIIQQVRAAMLNNGKYLLKPLFKTWTYLILTRKRVLDRAPLLGRHLQMGCRSTPFGNRGQSILCFYGFVMAWYLYETFISQDWIAQDSSKNLCPTKLRFYKIRYKVLIQDFRHGWTVLWTVHRIGYMYYYIKAHDTPSDKTDELIHWEFVTRGLHLRHNLIKLSIYRNLSFYNHPKLGSLNSTVLYISHVSNNIFQNNCVIVLVSKARFSLIFCCPMVSTLR